MTALAEPTALVAGDERGAGLVVRRADAGDRAALDSMFLRCSPQTVYRRFHGVVKAFPASYLTEALAGVPAHFALVACAGSRVVALASCRLADSDTAELGLLVEDAWQRHGIGRELLRHLVAHADTAAVTTLHAQVLFEQDWLLRLLREYGACTSAFQRGVLSVTVRRSFSGPTSGSISGSRKA